MSRSAKTLLIAAVLSLPLAFGAQAQSSNTMLMNNVKSQLEALNIDTDGIDKATDEQLAELEAAMADHSRSDQMKSQMAEDILDKAKMN